MREPSPPRRPPVEHAWHAKNTVVHTTARRRGERHGPTWHQHQRCRGDRRRVVCAVVVVPERVNRRGKARQCGAGCQAISSPHKHSQAQGSICDRLVPKLGTSIAITALRSAVPAVVRETLFRRRPGLKRLSLHRVSLQCRMKGTGLTRYLDRRVWW